jgi:hypothetical protein
MNEEALTKANKYKKLKEAYPQIPLYFAWLHRFSEDFFRRWDF